ncbi:hypothetical protein D3C80_209360 [compost metagenome]
MSVRKVLAVPSRCLRSVGLSLRRLSSLIMHVSRNVCYWDFFAIRLCVPARGIGQLPLQLQGSGHNDYAAEHLKRRLCRAGSNVGILVRYLATLRLTINDQDLLWTVRTRPTNTVPVNLVAFATAIERECSVRVRSDIAQVTGITDTTTPTLKRLEGVPADNYGTVYITSAPQALHRPELRFGAKCRDGELHHRTRWLYPTFTRVVLPL